ncbi:MAG: hypothetical protein WKG07_21860 [Hymenobacter sp.]
MGSRWPTSAATRWACCPALPAGPWRPSFRPGKHRPWKGHFHGEAPWMYYQDTLAAPAARVVGALPAEVVIMNTLTVNLHLLLISFYRPTPTRYKVLMEGGAFPSDQYALESQTRLHGFDPEEAIVEMRPRPGEHTAAHGGY